jgi:hypothetical protein
MGKGDRKTRRGKLFNGSYGRHRPQKPLKKSCKIMSDASKERASQVN